MAALASRVARSWKGAEGACLGVQQQAPAWGLCGTRKLVRWAMLHCWQCSEGWAGSSCDAEMLTECREATKAGAAVQIEKKQARQGACEAAGFSGGCARREMRWVVRMGGDGMRRAQVRLHGSIESGWCRDGCGRSKRMQACPAARLRW